MRSIVGPDTLPILSGWRSPPADGTVFTFSLAEGHSPPAIRPTAACWIPWERVYSSAVNNLAISPDGRALLLLIPSTAGTLERWQTREGIAASVNNKGGRCGFAAFFGRTDGHRQPPEYGMSRLAVRSHSREREDWCVSSRHADGRQVITVDLNVDLNGVCIWDIETVHLRRPSRGFPMTHNVAISPDGRLVAVGPAPPTFGQCETLPTTWSIQSGSGKCHRAKRWQPCLDIPRFHPELPHSRQTVGCSPRSAADGRIGRGFRGRDRDVGTGKPLRHLKTGPGGGLRIAYLPDGADAQL